MSEQEGSPCAAATAITGSGTKQQHYTPHSQDKSRAQGDGVTSEPPADQRPAINGSPNGGGERNRSETKDLGAAPQLPKAPGVEDHDQGADSCCSFAPKGETTNENKSSGVFTFTTLKALISEEPEAERWIVEGILPSGGFSVLVAKPKVGKTTLARSLAMCVARGTEFLGRKCLAGPVLYLCFEDKKAEMRRHFEQMGAEDEPILLYCGAAPGTSEGLKRLAAAIATHRPVLVVIDTLLRFIQIAELNDYGKVITALDPLLQLARETDCHIMAVHHAKKKVGEGEQSGDITLGSTAIFGTVDTLLIMNRSGQSRTLKTLQRYGTDMQATSISLDQATGFIVGGQSLSQSKSDDRRSAILSLLKANDGLTEAEIRSGVGGDTGKTGRELRDLLDSGEVARDAGGKKRDPYRYSLASPPSKGETRNGNHLNACAMLANATQGLVAESTP